jgi:hypothetical protein
MPEGTGVACLRERTREINLVHYHGGTTQRKLAKFLLFNTRGVDCKFALGPLFIQTKLMEEIIRWVLNKSANMVFFHVAGADGLDLTLGLQPTVDKTDDGQRCHRGELAKLGLGIRDSTAR